MGYNHDGVQPDIITMAKSISGGLMPISAIATRSEIMDLIGPGDHGSTYGGNPVAAAVAQESIKVILEEKLTENSAKMGEIFMD